MRLVLFIVGVPAEKAPEIRLEHVGSSMMTSHVCHAIDHHTETEAQINLHGVTAAHLQALNAAIEEAMARQELAR